MNALGRAGWIASAVVFATLLWSLYYVPHTGLAPFLLLGLAIASAVRPLLGVAAVVLIVPFASVAAALQWNAVVLWPETVACAVIAGLSVDAARMRRPLQPDLSAPALIFGALILTSMIASLGVVSLRLGPAFTDALVTHVTREHFVDLRGFPAMFAGLRLFEGVLLFALAARLRLTAPERRFAAAAAVTGAAIAGAVNIARLAHAASRSDRFFAALWDLAERFRWNVPYDDFNAAGSYFMVALLLCAGLVVTSSRARRAGWSAFALTIAGALSLTSSRVAFLAGALAAAAVSLMRRMAGRGRVHFARLALAGAATIVILAAIAIALPQRGNQQSALLSADVRIGLARTAARMIATRPAFGIGLGEFYQRSGEFASPELIAKFPVAVHENAHNNFLQIAAELGLTGGLAFVWLLIAGLVVLTRVAGTFGASHLRANGGPGIEVFALTAVAGFVLTCLGGHPLLVAEPAFVFWTLLGAMAATDSPAPDARRPPRKWVGVAIVLILLSLPWRMQSMARDADLEHLGIGVSSVFSVAPDDKRYREAVGHATLFVPTQFAYRIEVNPRTDRIVQLQLKVGGRLADVVTLEPNRWNSLTFPARTERTSARFMPLELRVVGDDGIVLWITKDEAVR